MCKKEQEHISSAEKIQNVDQESQASTSIEEKEADRKETKDACHPAKEAIQDKAKIEDLNLTQELNHQLFHVKPQVSAGNREMKEKAIPEDNHTKDIQGRMTIEEKRRRSLANKMTIEEKRALRERGKLSTTSTTNTSFQNVKSLTRLNRSMQVVCILSILMSMYMSLQIHRYFSFAYALLFISICILINIVILSLRKKMKLAFVLNTIFMILLSLGSFGAYRMSEFSNRVFDNRESETIMIIAKQTSSLNETSDFYDVKVAFVLSDEDTNTYAEEMLSEYQKTGYSKFEYMSYIQAFEKLMDDEVDAMVFTSLARQRLEEETIQVDDQIKILFQKNRELTAVEGKRVNITKDSFHVLVSGVDSTSKGINEKGSSDVNIVLTINPNTNRMMMQTIPRDTWTALPCVNGKHTKLTYAGAYGGVDCSIKAIESYLDIEINYYTKIDFNGVIDLVDALGGVVVNSDVGFCELHTMEGYGTKEYCYQAGKNELRGIDALMFSRIRKVFQDGDIERGRHQMEVINAVIQKFKERPSIERLNGLLQAIENNFSTNFDERDVGDALKLFTNFGASLHHIETYTMEGSFAWTTDEISGEYLYYFYPKDNEVERFKERMHDVMNGI